MKSLAERLAHIFEETSSRHCDIARGWQAVAREVRRMVREENARVLDVIHRVEENRRPR